MAAARNYDRDQCAITRAATAAIAVNGLRPQADNYILDGVDNNDGLVNTILFFPNIDATQEFKVNTSVAPAEYGRAGGAIVVSSIKSGTNEYHGSVFEFYRDRSFDSNPNYRFNGAPFTPAGGFLRNQPGFSVGGPICQEQAVRLRRLPGAARGSWCSPHYLTVPTALMRTGNFTELLTAGIRRERFRDPESTAVSPGYPTLRHGQPVCRRDQPGIDLRSDNLPPTRSGPRQRRFNSGGANIIPTAV